MTSIAFYKDGRMCIGIPKYTDFIPRFYQTDEIINDHASAIKVYMATTANLDGELKEYWKDRCSDV
jgi:hypothetical protein